MTNTLCNSVSVLDIKPDLSVNITYHMKVIDAK